jgi:sepiapterin reductase
MPPSSSCSSVVVFLITGASKGLGRAIATVASKYYAQQQQQQQQHKLRSNEDEDNDNSYSNSSSSQKSARFVLVARSSDGLQETKNEILSTTSTKLTDEDDDDFIICRTMDLSDLDRLDDNIDVLLDDVDRLICCGGNGDDKDDDNQRHDNVDVVFVNNAGSLGHLGPTITSPSLTDMRQTIDLNVTSSLWLTVRFSQYVKQLEERQEQQTMSQELLNIATTAATIVNISSLAAISDDFLSMGIYSTGKAARERYHTILAKEEMKAKIMVKNEKEAEPSLTTKDYDHDSNKNSNIVIKTLNYAPGPLETEMTTAIRNADQLDIDLKPHFQKKLLDANDSALKLIKLVDENNFNSGSHVDYYDLP